MYFCWLIVRQGSEDDAAIIFIWLCPLFLVVLCYFVATWMRCSLFFVLQ